MFVLSFGDYWTSTLSNLVISNVNILGLPEYYSGIHEPHLYTTKILNQYN
jgi:hypothetical protein